MGIPITPIDPIDGGSPTCSTYMPDSLKVSYTLPLLGSASGFIPRILSGTVNSWFDFVPPFFGPLVTVQDNSVGRVLKISIGGFLPPTPFVEDNCDFPLTLPPAPDFSVIVEDGTL